MLTMHEDNSTGKVSEKKKRELRTAVVRSLARVFGYGGSITCNCRGTGYYFFKPPQLGGQGVYTCANCGIFLELNIKNLIDEQLQLLL